MSDLSQKALQVHQKLLEFYGEPIWRNPLPPVDELVSTILSQNTNDVNRDRAFDSLRARFPTWEQVRDANTDEVIAAVRVAGLANQKGPRLQQVLRDITMERGSLDLSFLAEMPTRRSPRLADQVQRRRPEDSCHCVVLLAQPPGLPCGYARLPGDRPHRAAPRKDDRRAGAPVPGRPPAAGNILRRASQHHPPGTRDLQARKPNCPACPVYALCEYEPKTK
jgi:endonuclease III